VKDLYGNDDIEAMYQAALAVPLAEKIEMALMMIRTYESMALNLSDGGFFVCFSGGKDSIVMARLFEMAGVKHTLNYSNVTIDPPELVQFLKREYPHAIWSSPKKNLPMRMAEKGVPPTRLMRWCCAEYKEQGGNGQFKAIGVRAAESPRRKSLWQPIRTDAHFKAPIMSPILYWTDDDVWSFIRGNEMPYCSLYDEGFKRLGCIGCPMADKQRVAQFKRWPKYEAMWRRGFHKLYNKYKGVPKKNGEPRFSERFNSGDEWFDYWMETKNVNDTDNADCQMFLW
jgi:phosphoadenosine phosphosulfate reductase